MNSKTIKAMFPFVPFSMLALLGGLLVAALAQDDSEPARGAADGPDPHAEVQKIRDAISLLLDENTRLKEENAKLRKENQQLRRLLAEKAGTNRIALPTANPAGGVQTNGVNSGTDSPLTYWFSTGSGQRHNSRCRYYKVTEGRPCGPDEGKACKLCGG